MTALNPRPAVLDPRSGGQRRTGGPPARAVGRRGALPNGRAVVGGLLVAAAVVGTYAAWSGAGDGPGTSFVVAARDLPVGTTVGPDDLDLVALDLADGVAAAGLRRIRAAVVGQLTVAPLGRGRPRAAIGGRRPRGRGGGPAGQPLAITPADALAGTLEEGERVDVLVTFGDGDDAVTEVVVADALVARLSDVEDDDATAGRRALAPRGRRRPRRHACGPGRRS